MDTEALALSSVFDGWEGHQISLVKAVEPLTREQLSYRPAPREGILRCLPLWKCRKMWVRVSLIKSGAFWQFSCKTR
jgi:hypothetical protein